MVGVGHRDDERGALTRLTQERDVPAELLGTLAHASDAVRSRLMRSASPIPTPLSWI